MNITKRFLPIQCYGQSKKGLAPAQLKIDGIVQHYFSCINVRPADPYSMENCWNLMHDLNFEQDDREFEIYYGPKASASAHFIIGRDGDIVQMVPLEFQAWHAGPSEFNGRKWCNNYMVGIENVGSAGVDFTRPQYIANAELCAWLMKKYRFSMDMITGHDTVALPPGRKHDPGETFEWDNLRSRIRGNLV